MQSDVFAALANPVRRRVLELLLDGPKPAGAVAAEFDLRRPAVSEHLQVLRNHKLVTEAPKGRERHYSLNVEALSDVSDWLRPFERYWHGRVAALRQVLDESEER